MGKLELLSRSGNVELFRLVSDSSGAPEDLKRYISASIGYDTYLKYAISQNYWRLYCRESLEGHLADEICDRYFLAKVNGQYAARMWYGWNKRTGRGNFGNVFTEPEFRHQGLMNLLLPELGRDFQRTSIRMMCCIARKDLGPIYNRIGLRYLYGESGVMCASKDHSFAEEERAVYSDLSRLNIRPGRSGDQFDCDKFLVYTSKIYGNPLQYRIGPAAIIEDYRCAFMEKLSGNAVVNVLETGKGDPAGYAFAVWKFPQAVMDFTIHPDAMKSEESCELLRKTSADLTVLNGKVPFVYVPCANRPHIELLKKAGFLQCGGIPDQMDIFILQSHLS